MKLKKYFIEERIATIIPHPDGDGFAVSVGKNRWVSGGGGIAGGGFIGKWKTAEEAKKEGTKHLNKKKWRIEIIKK